MRSSSLLPKHSRVETRGCVGCFPGCFFVFALGAVGLAGVFALSGANERPAGAPVDAPALAEVRVSARPAAPR